MESQPLQIATDYIYVITDPVSIGGRDGGTLQNPYENQSPVRTNQPGIPVSVEKLEQGMAAFLQAMGRVIKNAQHELPN